MGRDSLNPVTMKRKTLYQKRIVELDKTIKPLGDEVIAWAKEYALRHPAVRQKNNATVCSMCGNNMIYSGMERNVRCLECGRHVQIIEEKTWDSIRGTLKNWFSVMEVIDGIQLQRTFEIKCKYNLKSCNHDYTVRELSRHWLSPEGEIAVTAVPHIMGQFITDFPVISSIKLRESSRMVYDHIADNSVVYPKSKFIDILAKSLPLENIILKDSQTVLRELIRIFNQKS